MKTYTMNFDNLTDVLKDFVTSSFRPGIANMNPKPDDIILLTSKEKDSDFAVGLIGRIVETDIDPIYPDSPGPTHSVEWLSHPKQIDSDFDCVQGGYISVDDRAHIFAQLAVS